MSEALKTARQAGDDYIAASSLNFMAAIMHQRGKLQQALGMAKIALDLAGESPAACIPYCRLCMIPYELNDLESAAQSARHVIQWAELSGDSAKVVGYLYQALVDLARGYVDAAVQGMADCDEAARDPRVSPLFHARHAAGRVTFAIRQNDLESAARWGRRLADLAAVCPFEFEHVAARLLIAQGKPEEAMNQLRDLHRRTLQADAHGLAIGIRVCQALAAGTEGEALSYLSEALAKGQPEGYVRTFVDEGKLLGPLLRKAMDSGVTPEYTAKLLTVIEVEQRRPGSGRRQSASIQDSILSARELEVLRLLASGLSNKQIGARLVISLNTAKRHVHNVAEKLDAPTRTAIVARARELRLI
jgi:LuxR family maltose regulon positive regulatory protein